MDPNHSLNILESLPAMQGLYTQICLCYSMADASLQKSITKILTAGLERLTASFPWIAGQVVVEGSGKDAIFKITPLDKTPLLIVKDYRDSASIPSMDTMREANFPFSMVDESVVAPRNTLPGNSETNPVFLMQASFIKGGLLLAFVGNHNAMDMTGQGHIISLFSKACRTEPFTDEEISTGNLSRKNLIPLLNSYARGPELNNQLVKFAPSQPTSEGTTASEPAPPQSSTWAYFTFLPSALRTLKSLASSTLTSGYVSTDDTLSAFVWQRIMAARSSRLHPTTSVSFARAVDVRRYLCIPRMYLGLAQNMTYHNYTLQSLIDSPLGGVASNLRMAVDPMTSTLGHDTRSLATFLSHAEDKNVVSFTATLDLGRDIMLSSWANLDCYELDFGLGLGKPEAVRRPQFVPVESLLYLMPKRGDGEISVAICLRDGDMERLKGDEEFGKFGTFVG
jgi:trichothecene 3-O-acetyltransferase